MPLPPLRTLTPPSIGTCTVHLLRASAALATTLLLLACGGGSGTADAGVDAVQAANLPVVPATPFTQDELALRQINQARSMARTCGSNAYAAAPPLRWNDRLAQAATGHSEWMQANDALDHTGAGGSTVGARVTAAGYDWRAVAENIAAGQADLASVLSSWLGSAGHCANIMNPGYVEVALAMKPGTSSNRYRTWWTLVLAQPR